MIVPSKIEAGCIAIFENIFDDTEKIISSIENKVSENKENSFWKWSRAGIRKNDDKQTHRTNYSLSITKNAKNEDQLAKNIHNQIYYKIEEAIVWYKNNFDLDFDLYHEPYSILRYENGEEYKAHFDGTTQTARAISILFYLNDDYEGGEIEFINFNLKIKPKSNTMIIFPSNYAYSHIAHKVITGKKYVIVTWLHDWLSPEVPQLPVKKSLTNLGLIGEIK